MGFARRRRSEMGENYMLTKREMQSTSFYRADKAWTIYAREREFTIIDIGDPKNLGFSEFLNMEYSETFAKGVIR